MLLRPIITERTMKEAARSRYTFLVEKKADKRGIAREISELFGVKVQSVVTVVIPGKARRFGKRAKVIRGQKTKKAIVTLRSGQTLSLFEMKSEAEDVGGKAKAK